MVNRDGRALAISAQIVTELLADVGRYKALERKLRLMGHERPANTLGTAIIYVRAVALSVRAAPVLTLPDKEGN